MILFDGFSEQKTMLYIRKFVELNLFFRKTHLLFKFKNQDPHYPLDKAGDHVRRLRG